MAEKKCTHRACKCTVREGQEYCSEHCRQHADHSHGDCQCGHAECR